MQGPFAEFNLLSLITQVLKDILEYRMLNFTPEQQDQWRAMKEFHDKFTTSDSVPNLPISIRAGT